MKTDFPLSALIRHPRSKNLRTPREKAGFQVPEYCLMRNFCPAPNRSRPPNPRTGSADVREASWGSKGGPIKSGPATEFGVGGRAVVERALAGDKGTAFDRLADGLFVHGKARPGEAMVGAKGEAVVNRPRQGSRRDGARPEGLLESDPAANFRMGLLPVEGWANEGEEEAGPERRADGFLVGGDAGRSQALVRPDGKAVG